MLGIRGTSLGGLVLNFVAKNRVFMKLRRSVTISKTFLIKKKFEPKCKVPENGKFQHIFVKSFGFFLAFWFSPFFLGYQESLKEILGLHRWTFPDFEKQLPGKVDFRVGYCEFSAFR